MLKYYKKLLEKRRLINVVISSNAQNNLQYKKRNKRKSKKVIAKSISKKVNASEKTISKWRYREDFYNAPYGAIKLKKSISNL